MSKIIPGLALGILLIGLGLCAAKVPHLRLAARLASGEVDGSAIRVTESAPVRFEGETVPVRCGELVFEVPRNSSIEPASPDAPTYIRLEVAGLKCQVFRPRPATSVDGELPAAWGEEIIRRRAAICRASGQELSFWMSATAAQALEDRLEVRPLYCLGAEQVEIVRGGSLSGLLLIWTNEGRPRMAFEYLSADERIEGDVIMLSADRDRERAVRTARQLVSSFRLATPESASN